MGKTKRIRVLLADDHAIVREGMKGLLNGEADLDVVADVGDGEAAVKANRELTPDVVVMDVGMPALNGIDATRQILAERPQTRVLCLSMHKSKGIVGAILRAGAAGYLVKSCVASELAAAIRAVAAGKSFLSPEVAGAVVRDFVRRRSGAGECPADDISDREREVLQLIAEGHNSKEIGGRLRISAKTVLAHRAKVMERLRLRSVADLTRYAIREGLVSL
jgi:DNA-binding NarL/FixJ family response regulator